MSIFKACDIRGVYGRELTEETFHHIGRAMGTLLAGKAVVVGGDVRPSTPSLKSALIGGLTGSGADVTDIGIVPTPAFYFAKDHLRAYAGAMVTASHNPPEFNGLKPILGPLPITEAELREIRDLSRNGGFARGSGGVREVDIIPSYISFIHEIAPKPGSAHSLKIVLDCGNGCHSGIAPAVMRDFGYDVVELFCTPDGSFPNRHPNSAVPDHLHELMSRVRSEGADLGIAFDGDGDRVSFVDEKGCFLSGDKAIVILSGYLLADNPEQKVIYDLKCSAVVPEAIAGAGGIPIAERSGHAFIKTRMIAEDALFGGELSGHYYHRALRGGDDGLHSALVMASMVADSGRRLSEHADAVPEYETTPDIRVPFPGNRDEIVERIASRFPPERVSRLDGVKVSFDDGWALARVSVTEPAITLRFEARNRERLSRIVEEFLSPTPELREAVGERSGLRGSADDPPSPRLPTSLKLRRASRRTSA